MCKVLQVKRSSYLSHAQLDATEKDKQRQQDVTVTLFRT
jgi:hypothetical protein